MPVEKGNKVKVEYKGTFEDGTVFDESAKHGQPLEFEAGASQVVKGFDDAIMGMEKGEEKDITLQPSEAYGQPNPEMVKKIPREQLPKDQEPKEGMMLIIGMPNGAQMPAKIIGVDEKEVNLDLNHPLAGKVLKFHLKVVDFS